MSEGINSTVRNQANVCTDLILSVSGHIHVNHGTVSNLFQPNITPRIQICAPRFLALHLSESKQMYVMCFIVSSLSPLLISSVRMPKHGKPQTRDTFNTCTAKRRLTLSTTVEFISCFSIQIKSREP